MGESKAEGKRSLREMEVEEEDEDDEELGFVDEDKKKKGKRGGAGASGSSPAVHCQAENCAADMAIAKPYHRRHKVCEEHAKASTALVGSIQQRFCQQCSRFHALSEFDDNKRSCRRRLAGHNERRRKSTSDYQGEGSN